MADRYVIESIHEMNTGHMPMIAAPARLAEVLKEVLAALASL